MVNSVAISPKKRRGFVAGERKKLTAKVLRTFRGRFAANLRELMDSREVSPLDLSRALAEYGVEVSDKTVHKWLRGESVPPAETLEHVGRALKLDDYRHTLPPSA